MSNIYNIAPTSTSDDDFQTGNYSILVLEYPEPQMEASTKANTCKYLSKIGITNPGFWWIN